METNIEASCLFVGTICLPRVSYLPLPSNEEFILTKPKLVVTNSGK